MVPMKVSMRLALLGSPLIIAQGQEIVVENFDNLPIPYPQDDPNFPNGFPRPWGRACNWGHLNGCDECVTVDECTGKKTGHKCDAGDGTTGICAPVKTCIANSAACCECNPDLYEETEAPTSTPSPTCSPETKEAQGCGDPHFKTWSGDKFDFHGECDLVLLRNPHYKNGMGFEIHIRTKIRNFYSIIHSAVVKVGNDILEVVGGDKPQYWVKGEPNAPLPSKLAGHHLSVKVVNDQMRIFTIALKGGDGERIVVQNWKDIVGVFIRSATDLSFGGSSGLLGSYPMGSKVGRDGVTVFEGANEFGFHWQVGPQDPKLFRQLTGVQFPQQCKMPNVFLSAEERRNLRNGGITEEEAHRACDAIDDGDKEECVFDVLATNDLEMALTYMKFDDEGFGAY